MQDVSINLMYGTILGPEDVVCRVLQGVGINTVMVPYWNLKMWVAEVCWYQSNVWHHIGA